MDMFYRDREEEWKDCPKDVISGEGEDKRGSRVGRGVGWLEVVHGCCTDWKINMCCCNCCGGGGGGGGCMPGSMDV